MRMMSLFSRKFFVGAIALATMALASQALADNTPQVVTVMKVKGMARYSVDHGPWQTLKQGDVLKPGCVIQTGPKSLVDIQMGLRDTEAQAMPTSANASAAAAGGGGGGGGNPPDEAKANVVRIFENTALGVDKLTAETTGAGDEVSDTQLDLKTGQILGNVKKLSAASKYEVKIPNGVAGIRGTVYMISAAGIVNVLTGSVVVAIVGADGTVTTHVVGSNQSYDASTNVITRLSQQQIKIIEQILQELHYFFPFLPLRPFRPILFVSPCN
jgi:FecR protein